MKKLMYLVILTLLVSVGCSKDLTSPDGLKDSVWISSQVEDSLEVTITLTFTTETDFNIVFSFLEESDSVIGTYIYSHPTINFSVSGESDLIGTVNGNNITIIDDGSVFVFVKQ